MYKNERLLLKSKDELTKGKKKNRYEDQMNYSPDSDSKRQSQSISDSKEF